jgi:dihydropyrimidinase
MSTVIKNGTVVTADMSCKAGVKIEDRVITEIGPNLSRADVLFHAVVETAEIVE